MNYSQDEPPKTAEQYRELYEKEMKKNQKLTEELVNVERENADLVYKLDKFRKSLLWKLTYPVRLLWSHFRNFINRIKNYRAPMDFYRKIKGKIIEKRAYKSYGTKSMPLATVIKKQKGTAFERDITISILVPLYNTPVQFLKEMLDSVLAQTYEGWELCLADGSDKEHSYVSEICEQYKKADAVRAKSVPGAKENDEDAIKGSRIKYRKIEKNLGISGNTNICFDMATGEYIGLFDHDDLLHPCVLFEYMKAICEQNADYVYCDETTFKGDSIDNMLTLHFKPDFSIDNLRANNYICHFSVFAVRLLGETGLFRSEFDGSQDHDMILRLTAAANHIVHIPKILYYWRAHEGSVAADIDAKTYAIDAAKRAVATHLEVCGFKNAVVESTRAFPTIFRIRYEIEKKAMISILIPNKDHIKDLKRCIDSIVEKSSYENYEIILIENNSTEQETFKYYEKLKENSQIKIIQYEGDFNYSAINNFGVSHANGAYILLLNNDTEVVTRTWMEEMLMYAQRKDVGAVGCMLYYENYAIQHAGIVIELGAHRTAGHTHYKIGKHNLGYMGRLCYAQNVTAVTGACLMVKKELWDEAGGLDEEFAVALNDVDFCLKLRKLGYLNIFTPFAEMYHYESKSRGLDSSTVSNQNAERYNDEAARFKQKWSKELAQGDPYYNVNFSLDHSNYTLRGDNDKSMIC